MERLLLILKVHNKQEGTRDRIKAGYPHKLIWEKAKMALNPACQLKSLARLIKVSKPHPNRIISCYKNFDMRALIVPVDFSSVSKNARLYAAHLAAAIKADLMLLHVKELPVAVAEYPVTENTV